ncbi:MAG TPA: bacteriohopanetetrol glucosamine biosynthesis glycosyltransferase HpnI [Steroidobacteraceae bacterium]|nr:bacteriohopanetetrol glucosamine biosynthesis glycosyltransferase HpnI [Steroidobacteraceae bacterium]
MSCGYLLVVGATVYSILAFGAARWPSRSTCGSPASLPKATVLKPLCGAEPQTYACLRSFCDQHYPEFQIIFGVAAADDPVLAVVRRLQREYPHRDLRILIDRRQHGSSRKVSNLINMMSHASHDYLVIADSDVCVDDHYLAKVVAPLQDAGVGIVTCAYRGVPGGGFWSLMGSLFINDWFTPSVYVAAKGGSRSFAFGATIALTREVLARIGGFAAIANHLADDYRLGELTRRLGFRTVLSEVEVDVVVAESSLGSLVEHELRWLRTIRAIRPLAYSFCFITFAIPVALLGALLSRGGSIALCLLTIAAAARVLLHLKRREARGSPAQIALIPVRDSLSLVLWAWSFTNRRVKWRNEHYLVSRDGSALPLGGT